MTSIATVTMNPTIDVSYDVAAMRHTHKMRTANECYAPGGGGINVARVFVRLGGNARCYYLSGGATGPAFDGLVDLHQLVRTRIPIAGPTRIASAVLDHGSGKEYRFTPRGPTISEAEWHDALEKICSAECKVMVFSGSLPPGVPADFYARASRRIRTRGIDIVLDSSGEALREGIDAGSLLLVKPSQGELQQYTGRKLETIAEISEAAMAIVEAGKARLVAVTLGHKGAVLARQDGPTFLPAPKIEAASTVGAGDSFVAGMVFALTSGQSEFEAFRFAAASGTAAVLRAGTGLAYPSDIRRLLAELPPL
jgi:hexose kinase, 1-phosphofructokinase family